MTEHTSTPTADDIQTTNNDDDIDPRDYHGDLEYDNGNDLARHITHPGSGRLYAYRSDDDNHHVVVCRGDGPRARWETRIPAEISRPIPGQQRWTVPDNWQPCVNYTRANVRHDIYYVPDTSVYVHTATPQKAHVSDSAITIKAVGELNAEPETAPGSPSEVHDAADNIETAADDAYDDYEARRMQQEADALRDLAANWESTVEAELEDACQWVEDYGVEPKDPAETPQSADSDGVMEFTNPVFKPGRALPEFDEYDTAEKSDIKHALTENRLLPSKYAYQVSVDHDDDTLDMEYYLRGLAEVGVSAAAALDYYMTEVEELTQTEWAAERGIDQSSVSGNVAQAKQQLQC